VSCGRRISVCSALLRLTSVRRRLGAKAVLTVPPRRLVQLRLAVHCGCPQRHAPRWRRSPGSLALAGRLPGCHTALQAPTRRRPRPRSGPAPAVVAVTPLPPSRRCRLPRSMEAAVARQSGPQGGAAAWRTLNGNGAEQEPAREPDAGTCSAVA